MIDERVAILVMVGVLLGAIVATLLPIIVESCIIMVIRNSTRMHGDDAREDSAARTNIAVSQVTKRCGNAIDHVPWVALHHSSHDLFNELLVDIGAV